MTPAKFLVEQGVTALKALRKDGKTILVCSKLCGEQYAVCDLSGMELELCDTRTGGRHIVMLHIICSRCRVPPTLALCTVQ